MLRILLLLLLPKRRAYLFLLKRRVALCLRRGRRHLIIESLLDARSCVRLHKLSQRLGASHPALSAAYSTGALQRAGGRITLVGSRA